MGFSRTISPLFNGLWYFIRSDKIGQHVRKIPIYEYKLEINQIRPLLSNLQELSSSSIILHPAVLNFAQLCP